MVRLDGVGASAGNAVLFFCQDSDLVYHRPVFPLYDRCLCQKTARVLQEDHHGVLTWFR